MIDYYRHSRPATGPDFKQDPTDQTSQFRVTELTIRRVGELSADGYKVSLVDTAPRYALNAQTQQDVDREIDYLSDQKDCASILFDPSIHPTGHAWFQLTKRAIALHTLYNVGSLTTLGEGINPDVYIEPLFEGKSAIELVEAKDGPEKAAIWHDKYKTFINRPMDDATGYYPSSKDFLTGVIDSQAIQTRADTAIGMVREYLKRKPDNEKEKIVCASLACGAAGPIFEMACRLKSDGINAEKLILVDNDPMALASAYSLAGAYGVEDKIQINKCNIMAGSLTDTIEPESVDVVDLLGIFEYIPKSLRLAGVHYNAAEAFLRNVLKILKPGGLVVMGNMLNDRPQQQFFKKVWPRLYQRDPKAVLEIIQESGLDPLQTEVRIPAREGVYAIYGMEKPSDIPADKKMRNQKLADIVMRRMTY